FLTSSGLTDKATYERIIQRERAARKEAERIMEDKSRELYVVNQELIKLNGNLENEVTDRTTKIKESEAQLNVLFDNHPFPIMVYNLIDLKILAVNKTAIRKYGFSKDEFLVKTVCDLHPKSEVARVKDHIQLIDEKSKKVKEWIHLDSKGNKFDVIIKGNTIVFSNEQARLVVIEDVTEKKILEQEKDDQKRKYQDLIESSSDIIFRINSKGIFTYINPALIKLSGYSEMELLETSFVKYVVPNYKKRVASHYQFQFDNNIETTYTEFPICAKDGTIIWIGQNVEASGYSSEERLIFNGRGRDITERKKLEKALLRSEEKYRSIIENMELGLMEVDPEGIITKAYPRFCELSGYAPQELEGRKGADFLLDDEGRAFYKAQLQDRIKGKTNVYEIQLIRKDGTKIWILVSGAAFYDEYNRFKGSLGIHLDISEQKTLEAELKIARIKAEDSLKSKELFMANISHEIRTPLNAIIGITELMNDIAKDPILVTQLKHVNHAGKGLLSLINELLMLSKIEAQKERIELSSTNLYSCLEQNFDLLRNQTATKSFDYNMDLNINKKAFYLFDSIKLGQVLQNLLNNAIKFTEHGQVQLSAQIFSTSYDSDVIQFTISDTGIGIPEESIDLIFKNFEQGKNNETGQYGGTGLGLPIVKNILDLMDGEISVSSTEDCTVFAFYLKLKRSTPDGLNFESIDQSLPLTAFNGIKVLIAEDNEVNKFLIRSHMELLNIDFEIVSNGLEACEYLKTTPVNLVLMDMRMPVLDGLSATKVIRNELKLVDLPIIALTANADVTHQEDCFKVGMNDFLSKPYSLSQLQSIILKHLNQEPIKTNRISKHPLEETSSASFQSKLNAIFITDSTERIATLKQAILSNNETKIKDICHSIRPSLIHLQEKELVELARTIESEECDLFLITETFIHHLEELIVKMIAA
ncbi:MAG: PAS domain S-box-containing protein, partial [Crocinitomicaceae bacterium]